MARREGAVLTLLLALSSPAGGVEQAESGVGISSVVLIGAAGLAALAALAARSGDDEASGATRAMSYASSADFRTSEFAAQAGLGVVRAESLYFSGHYQWYLGAAGDPAAGTGVGVKIAVGDTGINPREAATGSAIAIDAAASYDYVASRPGSAADDYGHGTHVAGIIAAPKNGAGMHGLAYNATLVNFKLGDASGSIVAGDAARGDMLVRAAAAGAMIANNSWATRTPITARSAAELQAMLPQMIAGARSYVAAGGVVVFAAGNDSGAQPSLEAGMPYRIDGLRPGWLAVVAIDETGRLGGYSNRCGVAAAWCLAAPGGSYLVGLYSMQNHGGYAAMYGTSMAAPHAAAAIAALKSMFPNLSVQQLRERLLFTANRGGAYADSATYGQGLMDLETASSPVGGVALPTGTTASGAVAPVAGSGLELPAGALRALGMQSHVLVVDNYQRAPFWMPAQAFFRESAPRIVERQLASLRIEKSFPSRESSYPRPRFSLSTGAGGEALLGRDLALAWLPRLAAPGTDSLALGYALEAGGVRWGFVGTLPAPEAGEARTLEASSLGSRRALAAVAQREAHGTRYGFSLALADGFERPIGIATGGAFGVEGGAAASGGAFVEHALARGAMLKAGFELSHHRAHGAGALEAPGYLVRSASLAARAALGAGTWLSASAKRDWAGDAAQLRVPLGIDEQGNIGAATYALPYDDLVGRTSYALRLDRELSKAVSVRASLTRERSGFGVSLTGAAAMLAIATD